jgi:hypothetical protein
LAVAPRDALELVEFLQDRIGIDLPVELQIRECIGKFSAFRDSLGLLLRR